MSLLSLAYLLLDKPMQKLFELNHSLRQRSYCCRNEFPKHSLFCTYHRYCRCKLCGNGGTETRIINTPDTPIPEVQLLSNGKYHVMITNAGAGYSRWKDLAVTRWREDGTCDNWGMFCYIRDLETGNTGQIPISQPLRNGRNTKRHFRRAV